MQGRLSEDNVTDKDRDPYPGRRCFAACVSRPITRTRRVRATE